MKKYFLLNAFVIISQFAFAQNISTSCFKIGGWGNEYLNTSILTYDGNYVMAGRTFTWTNSWANNVYVVKCNEAGDTLWTRSLEVGAYAYGDRIIETADHSLVIGGSSNFQILIIKLTADGDLLWAKNIKVLDFNEGLNIIETADGGYLICGETEIFNALKYSVLIKLDADGNLLWNKNYTSGYDTFPWTLTETSDHHYVVAGRTYSFHDLTFIFCVDSDGNLVWEKENTENGVWFFSVTTPDSNIVLAGKHFPDMGASIMKLSNNGDLIWSYAFGGSLDCVFNCVAVANDGGFIMAGNATGIDTSGGYVVKCDMNGQLEWSKTFNHTAFYSVLSAPGGGYIAFGEHENDLYFVKLDEQGNTCPDCQGFSYGTQHQGTGINNITFTEYPHAAADTTLAVDELTGGGIHIFCSEVGIDESTNESSELKIFPNPADELINVLLPPEFQNATIELINVNGKSLQVFSSINSSQQINVSQLREGIYLLQLRNGREIFSEKFIVHHFTGL